MAMNSDAPSKHGGSGGGELEKRVASVETRLGVIERTMVTAEVLQRELGALRQEIHEGFGELRKEMHAESIAVRGEIATVRGEVATVRGEVATVRGEVARMPFETVKWLLAVFGIAAAITTAVYNIWFR